MEPLCNQPFQVHNKLYIPDIQRHLILFAMNESSTTENIKNENDRNATRKYQASDLNTLGWMTEMNDGYNLI